MHVPAIHEYCHLGNIVRVYSIPYSLPALYDYTWKGRSSSRVDIYRSSAIMQR